MDLLLATVLYVAALAEHDLEIGEPLHLCAALGLSSASATGFNGSALTVGSVMDLQSFWGWDQVHVHDHVVETPLSWGHLQSTIVSGFGERTGALDGRFRIGSSSGVDCNLPNCYSVAPLLLHWGSWFASVDEFVFDISSNMPSKWHVSEECAFEICGVQRY